MQKRHMKVKASRSKRTCCDAALQANLPWITFKPNSRLCSQSRECVLGLISGLLIPCRAGRYTGICGRQALFVALVFCAIVPASFASFRSGIITLLRLPQSLHSAIKWQYWSSFVDTEWQRWPKTKIVPVVSQGHCAISRQ